MLNFWIIPEMPLINCEITLDLSWSANFVICEAGRLATFTITDTKLYVPVVTLDNGKLLQELKSGFKRTINWNELKVLVQAKN